MKIISSRSLRLLVCLLALSSAAPLSSGEATTPPYGENPSAGEFADINGIKMYYEVYGEGEPMALIHGNGQSLAAMHNQIDYFSKKYKVIVADSRAHGKTELGKGELTYVQMAADWAALIKHLKFGPTRIVGWSDGGNIGLRMAVDHPRQVLKLATMGANLQPDESAVQTWALEWVAEESAKVDALLAAGDASLELKIAAAHLRLLREQPNMSLAELGKIKAPVLVMAGDRDVIRDEHTVLMYQNIPRAHLAIFPGETHLTPATTPVLFNRTVDEFMGNPFSRPDTKDLFLGSPE